LCAGSEAAEVLYALAHPLSLVILLTSFLVAITLHGWVQGMIAVRGGDRTAGQQRRNTPDPRRHVDPFGAVGAALTGLGWGSPLDEGRRPRRTVLLMSLLGPAANLALGAALLLTWRAPVFADVLQRGATLRLGDLPAASLLLGGASQLYLGTLNLVPLPPLDGGRLLFAYAPKTLGWQKAEHFLVERNIGLVAVLVLLLLPLGGSSPALPALLDIVLKPVLTLLLGA
jgi:Zn-dependent protease